jgi:hypothetical protein
METAEEFIERKSRQWEDERDAVLRFKDIGRKGSHDWVREAWTWHIQGNYREKVLVIERMRHVGRTGERGFAGGADEGDLEYRFGYYIVGRNGRAAGRWVWGQFSPLIPRADLSLLLAEARREGTILD